MKDTVKAILFFWFIVIVILVWLQGGGRYQYAVNSHINLLTTFLISIPISAVVIILILFKSK